LKGIHRMNKLTAAITMFVIFMSSAHLSAQTDTAKVKTGLNRTVLILKGNSSFENAVAQIVSDTLRYRGYQVTWMALKSADKIATGSYSETIVFNAIKRDESLDPILQKYKDLKTGGVASNFLIFTVYGEKWAQGGQNVDAVSAATKAISPLTIANRILHFCK